ncbi:hypothetical protein H6G93_09900 [Nostoc sp. FACHB-973]|uniref:Uncharacterized protein n=1 Tax=Desmonostoc muscorum LEGE 12446 TaxID=1828758 RepID=A0A8J6ZSE0_DESMC|nr:hypothetical protein [Desmonostoc muscorum]MBD2515318.1 hypothetical protein [Nostoc sp. FACHB-973]MBX9257784.1 hypothetical protein [Desmonostoc muscorum CCALA 125]MCF2149997.1 hypothetical protein [Desmonostoc muscorum LEGE 12446]
MKNNFKTYTAIAVCCGTFAWGNSAYADGWPASVAGTWSVVGNQSVGSLVINQPSSTLNCKPISGTIFGTTAIEGFYCPSSGRIAFVRKSSNNFPYQYYQGNLSQTGSTLRIGGSFSAFLSNGSGGSLGEYNFSASK